MNDFWIAQEQDCFYREIFKAPYGNYLITTDEFKILSIDFIGKKIVKTNSSSLTTKVIKQFTQYFEGRRKFFALPLAMNSLTSFQQKVLEQINNVPYGKVISYKDICENLQTRSYQAVGSACGKNPFPLVIPCHRIIKSSGELGLYTPDPKIKQWLLTFEGYENSDTRSTQEA